jgi:Ca2+-transporting ATPase
MMTGDHLETAKHVAISSGLISEEEATEEGVVIDATEFRETLGPWIKIYDPIHKDYRVEFTDGRGKFDTVKKRVKVIARCTAEDKFIFVCGIKQKGGLVGMTGDSISDAEALQKADVGLCMGDGSDVAKDNSDLIILDNDFKSIHSAIKWGRAIFDNVRKFL